MCQRTRGERDSSREVDGEGDRVCLNVLYHFPLPLSFGHSGSGTQTAIRLTVLLILFSISFGLEKINKYGGFFPAKDPTLCKLNLNQCARTWFYLFNELPENEEKAHPSPPVLDHLSRKRAKTQSSLNQPWVMQQKVLTIFPWQRRQFQSAVCSAPTKPFCSSLFTVYISYETCGSSNKAPF